MKRLTKNTNPAALAVIDRARDEQSLRHSELRYRRVFEALQDGILILDAQTGAITDVNPRLIELLGYSREELMEMKLWQVGAFDDTQASKDAFGALQQNEYIRYDDLPLKTKDGRLIQVEFVSNVYSVGDENVIQCIIRDITEHKRLVAAMQENERRYRALAAQSPDGICLIDLSGTFLSANKAMCDALGFSDTELRSMDIWDLVPGQFLDQYTTRLAKILNGDSLHEPLEYEVRGKDGQSLYIEVMSAPYYGDRGVVGFQVVARDVTRRARAETALRESEERFRAWIEYSADFVTVIGSDGTTLYQSPSIRDLGYEPEELIGRSAFDLLHPDDRERVAGLLAQGMQTPGSMAIAEWRSRHRDGSWRVLEGRGKSVVDKNGQMAALINSRDITERKQAEELHRHRLLELEVVHSVSTALRAAQTRDEALAILLDETLTALETTAGAVWLYHPDGALHVAVDRGLFGHLDRTPMKPDEGIVGTVFSGGQIHISAELHSDPLARATNWRAIPPGWGGVCLPIRTAAVTVGVLFVALPFPRQIRTEQVKVLRSLAEIAGTTLHRLHLYDETVRQLGQLEALHSIDTVIGASMDLRVTLNVLLEHVRSQLNVDAACVLLLGKHSKTLEFAAGNGFRTRSAQSTRIRLGEDVAGRVALERRTIQAHDPAQMEASPHFASLWASEGFAAYVGVPLVAKGLVSGVLEVYHRAPFHPKSEWIGFLETLAGQAAIAIESAQLFERLELSNANLSLAYDATIEGWSRALDLRDRETEGHTLRVTHLAERLARAMGIGEAEIVHIRRGALLHDIGKMGVPDSILFKTNDLTDDEWTIMRQHPQFAFDMLAPIAYLRPALAIPGCHHEKWDGTGYPRGLKGEQIPLAARLFAVVDVWDALRSDRPYRAAWPPMKVLEHMRSLAGTHFDPAALKVFLQMVSEMEQELDSP